MVVLVVRGLVLVVRGCSLVFLLSWSSGRDVVWSWCFLGVLVCPWCLGRLVLVFVSCGGPWSCSWVVSRGLFVGRGHLVLFFVVVPV